MWHRMDILCSLTILEPKVCVVCSQKPAVMHWSLLWVKLAYLPTLDTLMSYSIQQHSLITS